MAENKYDVIIVGGGPSGVSAGIYSQRFGLKTLLIEKGLVGGQIALTGGIENYPGFTSIPGMELAKKFKEHAISQGVQIEMDEVKSITGKEGNFILKTSETEYNAKYVVVALGSKPRKLGVKGEGTFEHRGVHYCALCDGPLYKGKVVAIIGGGDSALKESITLARMVEKVYVVHRRDEFRAEQEWVKRASETKNIEFILDSVVEEFVGDKMLSKVILKNVKTNKLKDLEIAAAFIYVGNIPSTSWLSVEKNQIGQIVTNKDGESSIKGIFAAGDCVAGSLAQIATSVGEGVMCATHIAERLNAQ